MRVITKQIQKSFKARLDTTHILGMNLQFSKTKSYYLFIIQNQRDSIANITSKFVFKAVGRMILSLVGPTIILRKQVDWLQSHIRGRILLAVVSLRATLYVSLAYSDVRNFQIMTRVRTKKSINYSRFPRLSIC